MTQHPIVLQSMPQHKVEGEQVMDNRTRQSRRLWLPQPGVATLVMAACTAAAPAGPEADAPAAEVPATGAEESAEAEAAETPAAEEEDEATGIVQQSQASQSQVAGGVSVTSEEEVTSQ